MPADLRYQPLGIQSATGWRVTSAGGEAAANAANTLAANLARMSDFAFAQGKQQAAVEGREYGAANPVTLEQLKQAQETGEPPQMPGNTWSTYGRAAREGALFSLQKNISIDATQKINELRVRAETTEMPLADYKKELDSLTSGYVASVSQVSPYAAAKVHASIGATASHAYNTYATEAIKKHKAQEKVRTEIGVQGIIDGIPAIVESSVGADAAQVAPGSTEAPAPLENQLAAQRVMVMRYAYSIGDAAMAKEKLKQFNDAVLTAKTAVIAKSLHGDDGTPTLENHNRIMRGDMSGNPTQPLWDSLDVEEKNQVKAAVRKQLTEKMALDSSVDGAKERDRKVAVDKARIDFVEAWSSGDRKAQEDALSSMKLNRDDSGFEKYSNLTNKESARTEQGLNLVLENQLVRGLLTVNKVMQYVEERRLSDEDAKGFLGKVKTANDEQIKDALVVVKNTVGYPDRPMINPSAEDRRAMQRVATIHNAMIAAKRAADARGVPFDAYKFAQDETDKIMKAGPSNEDLRAAENQLKGMRKRFNIPEGASLAETKTALDKRLASGAAQRGGVQLYYDAIKLLEGPGSK